jgi:hypothetical protein
MSEEDRLYRRYWSGVKGEDMTVSKRQLEGKVARLKQHARDILRFVERIELPTAEEMKEGDIWDAETLGEMDETLEECKSILFKARGDIDRMTKPYRSTARQNPNNKNKTVECPECGHSINLKGRPSKEL